MVDDSRIVTNLGTLLLLEIVAAAGKALSAKELHVEIDLPDQIIHYLLTALDSEGFLIHDAKDKKFCATRWVRILALGLLNISNVHGARHQISTDVAAKTRGTVNFVVPQDNSMHYLDHVKTGWEFCVQLLRGSNVPFHCIASGKIFISFMKKAVRISFVDTLFLKVKRQIQLQIQHVSKRISFDKKKWLCAG